MKRVLTMVATLLLLTTGSYAQQPGQQPPDTTPRTPQEQALARLRGLRGVGAPDTTQLVPEDSIRQQPQGVQISGRDARAGATLLPRDSIVSALLSLRDYIATEYRGDTAHYHADSGRLELRGNAQVIREGNQLEAKERIVYEQQAGLACGYGEPVLRAAQMTNPLVSDSVCYYVERHVGRARGAETRVEQGATWIMRLDDMYIDANNNNVYSIGGKFTDCDLPWEHKHYYFGAKELKVVRNNVMIARNVTGYFADVPVFWLPFMVQSLSRGRRSGLLMPRFGINDIARQSSRYSRRVEDIGMFFALNDYMGAEVALDWFADNWTSMRGSLDYRFNRQFLNGGVTFRRYWKQEGGRDFTLSTQNSWKPDERTSVSLSGSYVTSTQFIQTRSFDPRELNRSIDSNAGINRRFDWGSLTLSASRRQFLSDNSVDYTLPSVDIGIPSITLFEALPGDERWYSNASWNSSVNFRVAGKDVSADTRNQRTQSNRNLTSGASSSFNMGRFSWSQRLDFAENTRERREFDVDTIPALPGFKEQLGGWSTSLSYQQRLMGSTTFTPGLQLSSQFVRSDSSGNQLVNAPTRLSFNAGLRTELYGFFPGVGPFERFRHRLSPSINYNYAPAVNADSLQRRLFRGSVGAQERNTMSFGLNQTIEAKYRATTVRSDTATAADTATGPRRRAPQSTPITLLSLSTDVVTYDFVRARDDDGFVTEEIGNSVQSDLLQGLQLSFRHDLFKEEFDSTTNQSRRGDFAPFLSTVNASFSLNSNSWLFRMLGLGRRDSLPAAGGSPPLQPTDPNQAGPAIDRTQSEHGLVGTSRRTEVGEPRGAVGAWNASFNYTLLRTRGELPGQGGNQMLNGNFSFQPTENWTVRWNTGYSFTTSEFTDHTLTLTRRLHDWDANFDFLKAQNGNFSFQFRVHLRANPDIKVDYSQNDVQTLRRETR